MWNLFEIRSSAASVSAFPRGVLTKYFKNFWILVLVSGSQVKNLNPSVVESKNLINSLNFDAVFPFHFETKHTPSFALCGSIFPRFFFESLAAAAAADQRAICVQPLGRIRHRRGAATERDYCLR